MSIVATRWTYYSNLRLHLPLRTCVRAFLKTFERDLTALGSIPLHPSLASNPESDAVGEGGSTGSNHEERSPSLSGRTDPGWETAVSSAGFGGNVGHESLHGKSYRLSQQQQRQQRGVRRVTLFDCVPIEREYKLLESCRTSQRRFGQEEEAVAQEHATIMRVRVSKHVDLGGGVIYSLNQNLRIKSWKDGQQKACFCSDSRVLWTGEIRCFVE